MHLNIGDKDPVNKILWDESKATRSSGGFALAADILPSTSTHVLKGAPISVDHSTRIANIVKTAVVSAGSTTTKTRVAKGHLIKVGDVIAKAVDGNAVAITAIDTSNADYDELTHLTNGGAFSENDVIFEAAAVGTGNAAYKHDANALLSDNIKNVGTPTLTAVSGALEIQEANLPHSVTAEIKASLGSRFQFI